MEFLIEGIFELIGYCYIRLMSLIVPDRDINERTKQRLKTAVKVVSGVLAIVLIIGLILFIQDDPVVQTVGRYMTFIPAAIIGAQIIVGIIVKIVHWRQSRE